MYEPEKRIEFIHIMDTDDVAETLTDCFDNREIKEVAHEMLKRKRIPMLLEGVDY